MRVDLYGRIHKAQRMHLFGVSVRIGRADFRDPAQAGQVKTEVAALLGHLRDHSENEKKYIHPLYVEAGGAEKEFDAQHEELEGQLKELEKTVNEGRWENLYGDFNRFAANYLLHIDEEEIAQSEILWKCFNDDRLDEVLSRFKRERPTALATADLEFMLPAMSLPELVGMMGSIKESAPESAFKAVCGVAQKALDPARWKLLEKDLLAAVKG